MESPKQGEHIFLPFHGKLEEGSNDHCTLRGESAWLSSNGLFCPTTSPSANIQNKKKGVLYLKWPSPVFFLLEWLLLSDLRAKAWWRPYTFKYKRHANEPHRWICERVLSLPQADWIPPSPFCSLQHESKLLYKFASCMRIYMFSKNTRASVWKPQTGRGN